MKILLVLVLFVVGFTRLNGLSPRWLKYSQISGPVAIDLASMQMLKDVYKARDDKNVVFSPLGVLTLLSLYSSGTNGTIRDEIVDYLGLPDYTSLTKAYQSLIDKFSSFDPETLTFANKVCVLNKYELTDKFRTATRDYHSEVETLNFTNPPAAANAINQWAELKTHGNIKNPVAEEMFTDAVAMLLNIIYFQWTYAFDTALTIDRVFHLSKSESVMKPTMYLLKPLLYYEHRPLRAKMIELPYKEAGFRMIVVLPDAVNRLPFVLHKLATSGILGYVHAMNPTYWPVKLVMPKFEVKSKITLKNLLIKEGVCRMFDEKAEGIVKGDGVKASSVLQETFVKVAEAATTVGHLTDIVLPISYRLTHSS